MVQLQLPNLNTRLEHSHHLTHPDLIGVEHVHTLLHHAVGDAAQLHHIAVQPSTVELLHSTEEV